MNDSPWLTPEQLAAWIKLQAVVELLPGVLDAQLSRDSDLSHYEYLVLAMLSEASERTLRMTYLAARTNATLSRLSHVVTRLQARGFVERRTCRHDKRATNAVLTDAGWAKLVDSAPGHARQVRAAVIDALTPEQVDQLDRIATRILERLDPEGRLSAAGPDEADASS